MGKSLRRLRKEASATVTEAGRSAICYRRVRWQPLISQRIAHVGFDASCFDAIAQQGLAVISDYFLENN